jgi:murein L,D-transpeptidase YcbB/YkuD
MGAHWQWLGYGSVDALAEEARSGIAGQVRLMARFIQKSGLASKLKNHNWAGFARGYNGPAYRKNRYDKKMARAYARHIRQAGMEEPDLQHHTPVLKKGSRGPYVERLQQYLSSAGYSILIDGQFGPATLKVVKCFQQDMHLIADGVIGKKTWEYLAKKTATPQPPIPRSKQNCTRNFTKFLRRIFNL